LDAAEIAPAGLLSAPLAAQSVQAVHSSPEVIWLVILMQVRFAPSLRNVEGLLFERRIDLCHGKLRLRRN
jgi:hypothetical protein